jgi:hypothetical protein
MIILRNLGLESNHQVILYPDITVHTHLKFTPISWGPTFDPTLPVSATGNAAACSVRTARQKARAALLTQTLAPTLHLMLVSGYALHVMAEEAGDAS